MLNISVIGKSGRSGQLSECCSSRIVVAGKAPRLPLHLRRENYAHLTAVLHVNPFAFFFTSFVLYEHPL